MIRTLPVLLLAVLLAGCGDEKAWRVGVALGAEPRDGVDLAVRELNGAGSVNGRPVRMVLVPDSLGTGKDPAVFAREVAQGFAKDTSLLAVIGHSTPEAEGAVAQIYNDAHVTNLVPTATAGEGPYIFHMVPPADSQAAYLVSQSVELWHPKRVAIAYTDNAYGKTLDAALAPRLRAAGIEVSGDAAVALDMDSAKMDPIAKSITSKKPEIVYWLGRAKELAVISWPLRQVLGDLKIVASDAVESPMLYKNEEGVYDGLVFVRFVDPDSAGKRYVDFQWRYSMFMSRATTSQAIIAYDAGMLLGAAFKAGAHDRKSTRDYIVSLGKSIPAYSGIGGPVQFDSHGWPVNRPLRLAEVTNAGIHAAGPTIRYEQPDTIAMPK
jgi:ABC-type branched-subunit amino acid transport system substrate-binding protein